MGEEHKMNKLNDLVDLVQKAYLNDSSMNP